MTIGTRVYWSEQASEIRLAYTIAEDLGGGEYAIEEPNGTEWIAQAGDLERI